MSEITQNIQIEFLERNLKRQIKLRDLTLDQVEELNNQISDLNEFIEAVKEIQLKLNFDEKVNDV